MSSSSRSNYGQIIEYIPDRLYLASYTNPPDVDTPFLYPSETSRRSPSKRSMRANDGPSSVDKTRPAPYYFSVDDSLLYNAFHHDFGPLHIGHLYRFAVQFHDILGAPENKGRPVVFWSKGDARSRANAACLLASYMVLIQSWAPHLALAPIAQADPPFMPFRDAGYSQADYGITVQDVVYGVWRAKEEGFCALPQFDLEEYERYERVDQGDFNWLTPDFLAFASPQHTPIAPILPSSPLYATLPSTVDEVDAHPTLPGPFKNVLKHFSERGIGLVVRLNSELYSPSYFTALGIDHLDMIFEDGTCPPLATVRKFITLAHETIIVKEKGIAVHCKAGLGRTGCLIGAYLIYRYGFTANETIAFMRFMRPGMVVGPQQHWLHLNQGTFRKWWEREQAEAELRSTVEAEFKAKLSAAQQQPSTPTRGGSTAKSKTYLVATPPPQHGHARRSPLGEVANERSHSLGVQEDCLPAPTPGQPRKTSRVDRHHPYSRSSNNSSSNNNSNSNSKASASARKSTAEDENNDEERVLQRETEMISIHHQSRGGADSDDAAEEQEWQLHMRTSRKSSSRSPGGAREHERSVSLQQTTTHTTTTTSVWNDRAPAVVVDSSNDSSLDAENIGSLRAKLLASSGAGEKGRKSTSGAGNGTSGAGAMKVRSSPGRRAVEGGGGGARGVSAGVRKTSGRVGERKASGY